MDEFGEKLNSLLNDPKQMESFASFAKSIMGGEMPANTPTEPELDPKLLKKLGGLLAGADKPNGRERQLLEAMKPYLSEKRRSKMDRAMKLAKIASVAELAASEFGGSGDV